MCRRSSSRVRDASRRAGATALALLFLVPTLPAAAQDSFTLKGTIKAADSSGKIACSKLQGETVQFLVTDDEALTLASEQVPVIQNCTWINQGQRLDPDTEAKVLVFVEHPDFRQYHGGRDKAREVRIRAAVSEFKVALSLKTPKKAGDDAYRTATSFVHPSDRIPGRLGDDWTARIDDTILWLERSVGYHPTVQRVRFLAELQQRRKDFAGCAAGFAEAERLAAEAGNSRTEASYRFQKLVCLHRLASDSDTLDDWVEVRLACNGAVTRDLKASQRSRGQVLGICMDALIESSEANNDLIKLARFIVKDPALEQSWKSLYYVGNLGVDPPSVLDEKEVFANLAAFSRKLGRTVSVAARRSPPTDQELS